MKGNSPDIDYFNFYHLTTKIINFEFDDWSHLNGKNRSFDGLIASCTTNKILNVNVFWKEGRNEIHIAILSS